jgi:hypothetical protein
MATGRPILCADCVHHRIVGGGIAHSVREDPSQAAQPGCRPAACRVLMVTRQPSRAAPDDRSGFMGALSPYSHLEAPHQGPRHDGGMRSAWQSTDPAAAGGGGRTDGGRESGRRGDGRVASAGLMRFNAREVCIRAATHCAGGASLGSTARMDVAPRERYTYTTR